MVPYRIFFRVIRLGSPQPALDLGERWGWCTPLKSLVRGWGSPQSTQQLTEKAHAIPTRQTKTRAVLMAAFSRNGKTHRGLAFQFESAVTTPNRTCVCVCTGKQGEEWLASSHLLMGSPNPSGDPSPSFFRQICLNFHEYILVLQEATKYQKNKFHLVADKLLSPSRTTCSCFPIACKQMGKTKPCPRCDHPTVVISPDLCNLLRLCPENSAPRNYTTSRKNK